MADEILEKLKGTVEAISFQNDENGYRVLEISVRGEPVTVVGTFPPVFEGEEIEVEGSWTVHSTYGRQFSAVNIQQTLPSDAAGMLRYLSSGVIKGIREATAVKIIEAFGSEAFEVIEKDPARLASIHGISKEKARKIQQSFIEQHF